ncbi:E3 ubiquitin-protein ligase UPL3 [Anopheles sinensis]|uniref:E3 ubiquitin-protein ligase UPL3 n=1 Tax=Anopheles sinensis TaxID=74873 RepID=A0A084VNT6_ANOSI|nr:E3 ubiquitin-protein ligase UPL3 [Anopheles sinensis]
MFDQCDARLNTRNHHFHPHPRSRGHGQCSANASQDKNKLNKQQLPTPDAHSQEAAQVKSVTVRGEARLRVSKSSLSTTAKTPPESTNAPRAANVIRMRRNAGKCTDRHKRRRTKPGSVEFGLHQVRDI